MYYLGLGKKYGFTLDTPIKDMSTEAVNALLYGTNGEKIEMHRTNEFGSGVYYNTFEGVVENLERRFRETNSEWMKEEIGSFMSGVECPDCHGKRLRTADLGGEADALAFAAGQGAGRAGQGQVIQTHALQKLQAVPDLLPI